MGREIKFRAWDKSSRRMAVVKSLKGLAHGEFTYARLVYGDSPVRDVPINQVCLEQFTGLLDKNGKEIYEGDIVQFPTIKRQKVIETVVWDDGAFMPFWSSAYFDGETGEYFNWEQVKVIGNIHEG